MPEPKRPLKVFLCHASTDKPKVRELYRYLKKRGIQPWFDEEDLVGGQDWQVEIPKALATSDAIIICLTKNSVDKEGYIQKEIKFALDKALEMPEGRIFLIPVKFEECEVPFSLSRYQWVDLTIESGYQRMMKSLKFRASQLERSTVEVSKNEVEEESLAREKKESEVAERAEREQREREFREKRAREAREKEKRETEKKEEKPVAVKPKTRGQIAYWFGGLVVVIIVIFLFSLGNNLLSNSASEPESTQTKIFSTATYTKTVELSATSIIPTATITLTPTFSAPFTYTVQDGDSLAVIAEKFNLGEDAIPLILLLNPFNPDTNIGIDPTVQIVIPGQVILLPNPDMKMPTVTPIPPNLPRGTLLEYTVQSGDSLALIASKFNSTIEAIIQENSIDNPNGLFVGQILIIPANLVTPTATRPPTSTPITPGPGTFIPTYTKKP